MPGLRGYLRWNASGIASAIAEDVVTLAKFCRESGQFSAAVAEFLRSVGRVELLQGQLIEELTTAASATTQTFPHGLGRPYRGAIVTGQSATSTTVRAVLPYIVSLDGNDPSKVFAMRPSAATAVTFSVWVFTALVCVAPALEVL